MSIELLDLAATTLADLVPDVVFVGGTTVGLWITDPAAPPARPTFDVDVVVEVATRREYYDFEAKLRAHDLEPELDSGVICRWKHAGNGLILDAMPTEAGILGFANRWQGESLPHAVERQLPSGAVICVISPPYLLATKLEAFKDRGQGDLIASRDFEDVVALVDGRAELVGEVLASPADVRQYVAEEVDELLKMPRFLDGLHGALFSDMSERADLVVLPALTRLAGRP